MDAGYLMARRAEGMVAAGLARAPAVILVGARQTGKSSLARKVAASRPSIIYDLEKEADCKALRNHARELRRHSDKLVIIDEVQRKPGLFSELRVIIDELRAAGRPAGSFLLLGSVTGRLQRQSEGLTGRVTRVELHPFDWLEAFAHRGDLLTIWDRGGYPGSMLARTNDLSLARRNDYIGAALENDVSAARSSVCAQSYRRLLELLAERQKDTVHKSKLGSWLGLRQETIGAMLASLEEMMLIRRLPAYAKGVAGRIVRNPKYYIRDSGIFHALINKGVADLASPAKAKLRGASWEGFVIQNLIAVAPRGWWPHFFKSHNSGNEIDLVFEKPGGGLWAIEIKSGANAAPARKFLRPLQSLAAERSFLVHGGQARLADVSGVEVVPLADMMNELLAQERRPPAAPPAEEIIAPDRSLDEIIRTLAEGGSPINLKRTRFIDDLSSRIRAAVADDQLAKTENDRLLWVQQRNMLLAWLAAEAAAAPEGKKAKAWIGKFAGLLEGMQNSLPPPWPEHGTSEPGAGANYDFRATFGRLCCHDLFVHAIAVLIDNDACSAAASLMGRKHYVHGHMLASVCLSADNPRNPIAGRPTVADFVTAGAARPTVALIEAEAVLLIHSLLAWEGRSEAATANPKYLRWPPWLLQAHPSRPDLPFFIKAEDRPGAENLLSCLGLAPKSRSVATAKKTVLAFLERQSLDPDADWSKVARCLNAERWHDLS